MANFSLFETFFFITLAITFILILLLVYHFKQRITLMEERCDKMFDIIQTMSQELNRQRVPSGPFPLGPPHFVKLDNTVENEMVDVIHLNDENDTIEDNDTHEDIEQEESEEESEESEESEDEKSDDESEDDADDEESTEEIQVKKIEVEDISLEQIGKSVIEEDRMEVYKKMNVNELKQKVIEKGLSTNTGKMKKGDLLNLLENE